ncbi:TonB-dependent receptor [Massilia terrae]|uniref:TonB-dependent receptor n=1 Tax=Massilia terrae TaxID=1811224 RepID=A0ABT2D548_9BURK|nr:TonB-dependent receptor [Massilia terrae]MCS0661219.1 TonB-dependent receptor [Massilia terrae]
MQQRTKIAIAVAVALHSMAAFAQEQAAATDSNVARVEVTGSRIRQVDLETAQPVQVMTAEQIQKSGLVTVGDIINTLSSTGTPAFSKGSVLTSNREQGGQYINLRNLGSQRLLVLVNGKRWTSTVAGYTDMSTVPSAMIDRIEVLKDGASSIYGSDAISGVVNIILKKSMEGGQLSVYNGRNSKGDGKTTDYSLTYGTGSEKASLMFGLTSSSQGEVWANARPETATSFGPNHPTASLGTSPWGRITNVSASGGSGTAFNKILNHTGSYNGDGTGSASNNIANYHDYKGADADVYNSTDEMQFQAPTRLTSIFTKGSLELPYSMRLTTTAMYAERKSSRQIAGYPLTSTSQSKFPVYIDKDSYYNPMGNQGVGVTAGTGQDLFFARRTIEVPRVTDNGNQTLHIDAVLEGDFSVMGKAWNWNVGYNHSAITGTVLSTGNLNLVNLKKALGPSFKNASGVVQCGTPTAAISLTECVPWDILGGPSASTPAALAYAMSVGQATYGSKVDSATADITGELFTLPAGAVGMAAGLERRTVSGYDRPGQFEQSGYSTDLAGNATTGKYTVKEAYLEFNIPLLKGLPMAELLSVDIASRYSDYTSFGNTTNSKGSIQWRPIKDILGRATYAQGFRAPTLSDTFGGGGQTFDTYLDPCDSQFGAAANDPAIKARCTAAGVPTNFRQKNQAGNAVGSGGGQTPVPFVSGFGNNLLTPETATTRTAGIVYSPSWLNGFTASLDYYDIRIKNRIAAISANQTVNFCYVNNDPAFCGKITRDPLTGQINNLLRGNANLGETQTKGLDFSFSYRFPRTAFGQFNIRSESTWVKSYRTKSSNTADWTEFVGEWGTLRLKSNLGIDWNQGNWSSTVATRYYSGVRDRCWTVNPVVECSDPTGRISAGPGLNRLPAQFFTDLSVGYKLPWNAKIMGGINNLLKRKPQYVYTQGSSSSSTVDAERPIDRFFYVRYNQGF